MRLVIWLALRDLLRDRVHLICNVAVLAGVLVPLLVLFGVKNGVYQALIGRLLDNPATMQIDTAGNSAFGEADIAEVRGWPQTAFATLKTRALFDYVNIRAVGGREKREAVLEPTGTGDPILGGAAFGPEDVAISAALADQLRLAVGSEVELVTQADDRPRQLRLTATVRLVAPAERLSGRVVLADIGKLDLIEAFYDSYALPDHGITAGKPLSERSPSFEGMRVFAGSLETVAPLQARIEQRFGLRTEARVAEIESTLALGRNLDLALALTATVAGMGLAASLIFGFWGEVARKRRMIATLGLLGLRPRLVSLFPLIQGFITAVAGLAVSFIAFLLAAAAAERLFGGGIADGGRLVVIGGRDAALICLGTLGFVTAAALFAARAAQRLDPASVLREWS